MFENSGSKLRVYALVMFWITFIGAAIGGLVMISEELVAVGIGMIAGGFLIAFLSTLPILALADAAIYAETAAEEVASLRMAVEDLRGNLRSGKFVQSGTTSAKGYDPMAYSRNAYQQNTERFQQDL